MSARTWAEMRERWDLRARRNAFAYIECVRPVGGVEDFFALGDHFAEVLVDPVLESLPVRRERALDHGCGLGRVTRPLGERFEQVVGIDVSGEMVRRARELHPAGEFPNVSFAETEGRQFGVPPDSFDFVFSYEVFQHMPSRDVVKESLAEIGRVLRPDGLALIHLHTTRSRPSYWVQRAKLLVPDSVWGWLKRVLRRGDPLTSDATFRGTPPLRRDEIGPLLASSGLELVELREDPTHEPGRRVFAVARRA
jgi:SAM-dependent methyltransferase